MKKLLFFILVVVSVTAAGPYLSGRKAEQELDRWVAAMNESGIYEVSWDYYDKKWLSSNASLIVKMKKTIDLPLGEGFVQDWVLPVNIDIYHGPLLVTDHYRLGWFSGRVSLSQEHEGWIKDHIDVEGEGAFYTSNLFMDLQGNLNINDSSLPFSIDDNGEKIWIEGYMGQGTMRLNKELKYSGFIPSIQLSNAKGSVLLEEINIHLMSILAKKHGQYLTPGDFIFSVKSVAAHLDGESAFLLDGLQAKSSMVFGNDGIDAELMFDIGFKSLNYMGEALTDAKLSMSFERLNLTFVEKYFTLVQQFGSIGAGNSTMMLMQMSGAVATDLLPSGPRVSVSALEFTTMDGQLALSGSVEVSPEAASKMSNPLAMISDIHMEASAKIDKALAQALIKKSVLQDVNNRLLLSGDVMTDEDKNKEASQQSKVQLDVLIGQNLLVEDASGYSSSFLFKDGIALLNGKDIPLPFL